MPEAEIAAKGQTPPALPEDWQDQVVADAIGYTKGLVAILESLNEAFRHRGRLLEEQKQRLTILQNERRAILQERAGLEAQLHAVAGHPETSHINPDAPNRNADRLRDELDQVQRTLEARNREIQGLEAALSESARRADELRQTTQQLDHERKDRAQLDAQVEDVQRELAQAREALAGAQAEAHAAQQARASTPELLEAGGRDLAASQQQMETLRAALDGQDPPSRAEEAMLRSSLEERNREIDRFRQDVAQLLATLEARTRETRGLQEALEQAKRQAADLRSIVRRLERAGEDQAQVLERVHGLQRELAQARGALAGAQAEVHAARQARASTPELLEAGRRDLAASQQQVEMLRAAAEDEKARASALQEREESRSQELSRLSARTHLLLTTLGQIAAGLGYSWMLPEKPADPEALGAQLSGLAETVQRQAAAGVTAQRELAAMAPVVASLQEVLGTTDALSEHVRTILAERDLLTERVKQLSAMVQKIQRERAVLLGQHRQLQERCALLSKQSGARGNALPLAEAGVAAATPSTEKADTSPVGSADHADAAPERVSPRTPSGDAAQKATPPADSSAGGGQAARTDPPSPREPSPRRQAAETPPDPIPMILVECLVTRPGQKGDPPLRGKTQRVNEVGIAVVLEKPLLIGRFVSVRLVRDTREFSVPGSVVRVQPAWPQAAEHTTFDHRILFDHPGRESVERLRAFLAKSPPAP